MKQALPIQQPAQAQLSSSSVVRQPATHPWLCSLGSAQRGRSGLSNVSETGLRPTTSLTCLRLVSSYASCLTCPSPSPAAQAAQPRLARPCSSQQLATQPQAQVCMRQALPIQQPAQAQPSRSSRRNQQRSPAAQQPATETSFRPSPTSNLPNKQTSPKPTLFQTRRPASLGSTSV